MIPIISDPLEAAVLCQSSTFFVETARKVGGAKRPDAVLHKAYGFMWCLLRFSIRVNTLKVEDLLTPQDMARSYLKSSYKGVGPLPRSKPHKMDAGII